MRSDQLDLALLQSRLLIHDVIHKAICREHPRVRRVPIIFDAPLRTETTSTALWAI